MQPRGPGKRTTTRIELSVERERVKKGSPAPIFYFTQAMADISPKLASIQGACFQCEAGLTQHLHLLTPFPFPRVILLNLGQPDNLIALDQSAL